MSLGLPTPYVCSTFPFKFLSSLNCTDLENNVDTANAIVSQSYLFAFFLNSFLNRYQVLLPLKFSWGSIS